MAPILSRKGRSRRYGNVVPRMPAGPMDIGRSLRGPHPGRPPGGGRGFGPGKRVPRVIQGPGGLGGRNTYGRPLPGGMVQTPEGPKQAPRSGGHLPRVQGKGLPSNVMAQIQFLREAKNNLNVQHRQAIAAKTAAGLPADGKYTSGPLIGQPAPPNPTPGKIPSGPRKGQPTKTALRMAARARVNSQLAQLRADAQARDEQRNVKHDIKKSGNTKHDIQDRMAHDIPARGSRNVKHDRVYRALLRKSPRRPRGRKAYNTFT